MANFDAAADLVSGHSFAKNIGKNITSSALEGGAGYTLDYLADVIAGNPDAQFDWDEFAKSIKGGAGIGAAFGTGAAAIGAIGKTIDLPPPDRADIPDREIDVDYTDIDSDAQYYRDFAFDVTDEITTDYNNMKCTATKVTGYDKNIYVSNRVRVKRRQLGYINTRIDKAAYKVAKNHNYELPRIIICDVTEMEHNKPAVYTARDNTLRLNYILTTKDGVLSLPKDVACADNHNNVFVHEMLHWYDAQRYKETHGSIDGYMDYIRRQSKKHIDKLTENGYNVKGISQYAAASYAKGDYDEVWTEYRVKQILGGK